MDEVPKPNRWLPAARRRPWLKPVARWEAIGGRALRTWFEEQDDGTFRRVLNAPRSARSHDRAAFGWSINRMASTTELHLRALVRNVSFWPELRDKRGRRVKTIAACSQAHVFLGYGRGVNRLSARLDRLMDEPKPSASTEWAELPARAGHAQWRFRCAGPEEPCWLELKVKLFVQPEVYGGAVYASVASAGSAWAELPGLKLKLLFSNRRYSPEARERLREKSRSKEGRRRNREKRKAAREKMTAFRHATLDLKTL